MIDGIGEPNPEHKYKRCLYTIIHSAIGDNRKYYTQHINKVYEAIEYGQNLLNWHVAELENLVELRRGVFPNVEHGALIDWHLYTFLTRDDMLQIKRKNNRTNSTIVGWVEQGLKEVCLEIERGLSASHLPTTEAQKILNDLRLLTLLDLIEDWPIYRREIERVNNNSYSNYPTRFRRELKAIYKRGKVFYTTRFGGLNQLAFNGVCDILDSYKNTVLDGHRLRPVKKRSKDFTSNWSNGNA